MTFAELDLNGTYTYADYLKWTFEERLEIIKGKIFPMSAPARIHQRISSNLFGEIYLYLRDKKCEVYSAPFDVRLTPLKKNKSDKVHTIVQPDICVICDLDKLDDKGCVGAPDLMIEILSPGNTRKEMKEKYEVYEENGVKEYWLVEPQDKCVFVYVLNEAGKYIGLQPVTDEDILISTTLPDLQIDLSRVFDN
ncbi:MAG: Uma2 family endonuclease [Arcicella sp.]|jgi:Uma2 family endonuclease|nr:Uma2 family endonuclease [Arcicella sp.]